MYAVYACSVSVYTTQYPRAARSVDLTLRSIERTRIMYHYLNGTIYSGIITRQDIKFVMGYFDADISCRHLSVMMISYTYFVSRRVCHRSEFIMLLLESG